MGDRYGRSGRRSPIYDNYGRTSLPSVPTTYYGGDIHAPPVTRYETVTAQPRHHHHHSRRTSNTQSSDWRGPAVPVTTTTYTVKKDPVTRSSSVREHSRTRSATIDSTSKRPPVIVTTRQAKESSSSANHSSSRDVAPSPVPDRERDRDRGRHSYRTEDGYFISQPASSLRSHSHTRYASERDGRRSSAIMSSTLDDEEFRRLRQRTNDERLAPSWGESRRERPSSYYGNPTRQSTSTVDLGDTGFEYTNPGALLRYDLDHDRRGGYTRPTVTVSDLERRQYDSRARGPPPTTRGLDKVNRRVVEDSTGGIYDRPAVRMPVPAVVAAVPFSDRRASQVDIPPSPIERRPSSRNGHRPTSLYQDEYSSRDSRPKDYYREDDVASRGFGVRAEGEKKRDSVRDDYIPTRERRRDSRMEDRELRRHSDDENDRYDRQYGRDYSRKDESSRPERKNAKDDANRDDDRDKGKLRDKVATGLSLAAGAIGLGGALSANHKDKDEKEDKGSPRRRTEDEVRREDDAERSRPARRDREERQRDDSVPPPPLPEKPRKDRDHEDGEERDRKRREAEARLNGEAAAKDSNSSADEGQPRRRPRPASAFKPNDTAGLMALKEQLKAQEESEKENDKQANKDASPVRRSSPSVARDEDVTDAARSSKEDLRGRGEATSSGEDRQVRVVSPPRDKDDKKPIKGILKQPKPQFPEEPNPVREGVAPHKDDKSKGNVPAGARWTKIARKLVNPEALTIGKERFEVRDDFVIVLRVLNKEEIEAYTAATAQLRDMRRKEYEEREKDDDRDDDDDEPRRSHKSHRRDPRDEEEDEKRRREERRDRDRERERDRDREPRSRRHRYEDEDEPLRLEYSNDERDRVPFRSHRNRDRERERDRETLGMRND